MDILKCFHTYKKKGAPGTPLPPPALKFERIRKAMDDAYGSPSFTSPMSDARKFLVFCQMLLMYNVLQHAVATCTDDELSADTKDRWAQLVALEHVNMTAAMDRNNKSGFCNVKYTCPETDAADGPDAQEYDRVAVFLMKEVAIKETKFAVNEAIFESQPLLRNVVLLTNRVAAPVGQLPKGVLWLDSVLIYDIAKFMVAKKLEIKPFLVKRAMATFGAHLEFPNFFPKAVSKGHNSTLFAAYLPFDETTPHLLLTREQREELDARAAAADTGAADAGDDAGDADAGDDAGDADAGDFAGDAGDVGAAGDAGDVAEDDGAPPPPKRQRANNHHFRAAIEAIEDAHRTIEAMEDAHRTKLEAMEARVQEIKDEFEGERAHYLAVNDSLTSELAAYRRHRYDEEESKE